MNPLFCVFVDKSGRHYHFEVARSSLVFAARERLAASLGVPPDDVELSYENRPLPRLSTFDDIQYKRGSAIHLSLPIDRVPNDASAHASFLIAQGIDQEFAHRTVKTIGHDLRLALAMAQAGVMEEPQEEMKPAESKADNRDSNSWAIEYDWIYETE
jgi:hypothetical protein